MSDEINLGELPESHRGLRLASTSVRPEAAAGPAPQPMQQGDSGGSFDEPHLADYLKVLVKRRWTAATVFLLVFVTVTVYTFTVTPIFEASTRLMIEAEEQNVVAFQQVVDQDQAKADYYQTQYSILQSRSLARKTIEALKLADNPLFGGGKREAGALSRFTGMFKSAPAETAPVEADETLDESRRIDAFLSHLSVAPIRNSRLVDLKYRLSDGALATRIVNSLAKNYIQQNLEYKFTASKEATDWLGERLAEQRKGVEQAESKLQVYREQNDAISLQDRENIVVQKLGDLNAAVTKAKTERLQKEALYRQLSSLETDRAALDTFPAILGNPFIQQQKGEIAALQRQLAQLSEKLGDKHPDIVRLTFAIESSQGKLEAEIGKVVQSVKNEYQAAQVQEQSLAAALGQQKGEALAMNRKGIAYSVLDREVQSNKQIYESLMQRAKETGVSGELKTSNIRVVDQAERPRVAVSPRKALNLALGFLGGCLLAFGLSFFFEYLDSRIKTPDEIKAHLGLPFLGMVPALPAKALTDGEPLISGGVTPGFAEAFRALRTSVLFSNADEGSRSMVVTSSGPGEGKTTIATNLAVGLAQTGQRVLIIDADMRRPSVHTVFNQPQEPGLSNLLVGNAKPSECVRKTSTSGLWVMPAGHVPPNPAELLGSQRYKDFTLSLREHFDWVIIDTPPVMAVTDAVVAAHTASGVLFVVGAEMTSRQTARTAIEQLSSGHARFVGAVLNRVQLEKNAYYYSQYYNKEYSGYYQKVAS
jgi:capsular exopolysaccharide synthesis family protein